MRLLNYQKKIWTTITQTRNQGPDGQKIKGIDNAVKNNFDRTIFLSGQFFCQDNFFARKFLY